MRAVVLACILLFPLSVAAYWVALTPCGMEPTEKLEQGYEKFVTSPNLKLLYIWAPAIVAVLGYTERSIGNGLVCSTILVPGRYVHVQGDPETIIGRLKKEEQNSE